MDDDIEQASMATVAFERDLEALVLEAFARGARVEGTWEICPSPSTVPDWTIQIRRHSCTGRAREDTVFEDGTDGY
ncbi:hypothetical protein [Natronobiforma cellulositropha]|uniref:hypothetical protein n=1 Tax=Natronobiforma cellulositropha TaxID=1679076 RepID=UPI0021D58717|nr:hypothetical protein [Natronobiforma cellulositropha]